MMFAMSTEAPAQKLKLRLAVEEHDQLPDLIAVLENTSSEPIKIWSYMLEHRLLSGLTARSPSGADYGLYPFRHRLWDRPSPNDLKTLAPGQKITIKLPLSKSTGWGFVRTGSQPPVLSKDAELKRLEPGTWTVNTVLFPSAAVYTGQEGVHDRRYERKRCPFEGTYTQELEAAAEFEI